MGDRQGVLNLHSAETEEFMTGGTPKVDYFLFHKSANYRNENMQISYIVVLDAREIGGEDGNLIA